MTNAYKEVAGFLKLISDKEVNDIRKQLNIQRSEGLFNPDFIPIFETMFPDKMAQTRTKIAATDNMWETMIKSFILHIELAIPIVAFDLNQNMDQQHLVIVQEYDDDFIEDLSDDAFQISPDSVFLTNKYELIEGSFFGLFYRDNETKMWWTLRPFITKELWKALIELVGTDVARLICSFVGIQGYFKIPD